MKLSLTCPAFHGLVLLGCLLPALASCAVIKAGPEPAEVSVLPQGQIQIQVGELLFDAMAAGPGDGEGVLLLHGFPQTNYSFRHQQLALSEAGYRVIAPNQRGYSEGARPSTVEAYAIPNLVQDILDIANAQGFERFHLVGHDWGAAVAWYFAAKHPERLFTLSAISVPHPTAFSDALNDPGSSQRSMSGYMNFFRAEGTEQILTADESAGLRQMYAGLEPEAAKEYVRILGTPEALAGGLNWYRANRFDETPEIGPILTPTLFVWSDEDSALGRDGAEATVDHVEGHYRFEVLPGINHWVPEEAPLQLNQFLLEHLGAHPDRTKTGRGQTP